MLTSHQILKNLLDEVELNEEQSSSVCNIKQIEGFSVQHIWTAGSVSRSITLSVEASLREDGPYVSIDEYVIDGEEGSRLINVEFPRYNYVKIATSNDTAGGGTLTSTISGKTF